MEDYQGEGTVKLGSFSVPFIGGHHKDYSKAKELNPNDGFADRGRGLAFEKLGDTKRAIEDHDKTKKVPPKPAHR